METEWATVPTAAATDAAHKPWRNRLAIGLGLVWGLGTLLRWTIQDSIPVLSAVFYSLPVPLLVVIGGIVVWRAGVCGRRWTAVALMGVLLIQTAQWSRATIAFRTGSGSDRTDSIRLLSWNVSRGDTGYPGIAAAIAEQDADVVALVEATRDGQSEETWTKELPGYTAHCCSGGMTLLLRSGELLEVQKGGIPNRIRYRICKLRIRGQDLTLVLVDIKSDPLIFRRSAYEGLARVVAQHADANVVLLGDFNTPVDSVHAELLRGELTNAFEAAGTGYRETWPALLPVLSLDQVWGSRRIRWQNCRRVTTLRSDHRMIVAEFVVE